MATYILTRVPYGNKKTPINEREYSITFDGPVGTKREWRKWAKDKKVKVKFKELTEKQFKEIKRIDKFLVK